MTNTNRVLHVAHRNVATGINQHRVNARRDHRIRRFIRGPPLHVSRWVIPIRQRPWIERAICQSLSFQNYVPHFLLRRRTSRNINLSAHQARDLRIRFERREIAVDLIKKR